MQSYRPAADVFVTQSNVHGLHLAIIMDGNGRWASRRGLPRVAGHRAGAAAARRVIERAADLGVRRLTLYAFSSDNWRRPAAEVQRIFWLLRAFLRLEKQGLRRRGAQLEVMGRRDRLPEELLRVIEDVEGFTAAGCGLQLRVAVDYSSREAIARALAATFVGHPLTVDGLALSMGGKNADVDLLIRTGGEMRLSDFLLWECAYAELLFTDRMWPDFNGDDLEAAMVEFSRRERRFGGVPERPGVAGER